MNIGEKQSTLSAWQICSNPAKRFGPDLRVN